MTHLVLGTFQCVATQPFAANKRPRRNTGVAGIFFTPTVRCTRIHTQADNNAITRTGSSCPFYSLLKFEPDHIEYVSVSRYNVQSGRDDWLPVTLEIANGAWELTVAPAPVVPTPSPPPSPPTPAPAEKWVCTVCQHVYDPAADGGGKPFEDLPDTWLCPVCGQPKSAYKKQSGGKWMERI